MRHHNLPHPGKSSTKIVMEYQPRESPLRQIILILGGFHTEMSFLGSIGSLMAGTDLKEVMSQVYFEGSVAHMISVGQQGHERRYPLQDTYTSDEEVHKDRSGR